MFLSIIQQFPFIIAFLCGIIAALIWLFFWIKEDIHPEPPKMITLSFIGGMVAVFLVLPVQTMIHDVLIKNPKDILTHTTVTKADLEIIAYTIFAAIEEIFKFILVYYIALRNKKITDEPVDDIIYLIVSAIGFAAMENTLYIANSLRVGDVFGSIISLNLRFIGATLLHIVASATIGICMAFAFYKPGDIKKLYLILGIITATALHTIFNLFIISITESEAAYRILYLFGGVWILVIGLLLLFEKIKNTTR